MTLLPLVLPVGFIPKVSVNDKLTKGSLIAEKRANLGEEIISLTKQYGISAPNIRKSLKKNLGDFVKTGELVAVKSGSFGIGSKKIFSPFSGTIAKIDETLGEITIKTKLEGNTEQMFSPVEGKVEICNNEKIVVKTNIDAIIAEDCLGPEAEGKIFYVKNISESSLSSQIQDKVLLIETIDKPSVFKAIGLDVLGVITQELEDIDFVDLLDKKINIPIMIVSKDNFDKLEKRSGQNIYINGKDKSLVFYE